MKNRKIELTDWEKHVLAVIPQFADCHDLFLVNVTSVAKSGMSRTMQIFLNPAVQNGNHRLGELFSDAERPMRITHLVAKVLGYPETDKGLRVSGCGMDMVFAVLSDFITYCNRRQEIDGEGYRAKAANNYCRMW